MKLCRVLYDRAAIRGFDFCPGNSLHFSCGTAGPGNLRKIKTEKRDPSKHRLEQKASTVNKQKMKQKGQHVPEKWQDRIGS